MNVNFNKTKNIVLIKKKKKSIKNVLFFQPVCFMLFTGYATSNFLVGLVLLSCLYSDKKKEKIMNFINIQQRKVSKISLRIISCNNTFQGREHSQKSVTGASLRIQLKTEKKFLFNTFSVNIFLLTWRLPIDGIALLENRYSSQQ